MAEKTTNPAAAWGTKAARAAALCATAAQWRDWANLTDGPAVLIAERVLANDVADYIRFRSVCRPWRRCSDDPRRHSALDSRFHPRQWLIMLGEKDEEEKKKTPRRRRFMNTATGQCVSMDLPELHHGHRRAFGPTAEGLSSTSAASSHPYTTVSVVGAGLAGDRAFALAFGGGTLAVAWPGSARWTPVGALRSWSVSSSLSFAGRFYCVADSAVMVLKDVAKNQTPRMEVVAELARPCRVTTLDTMHLVEDGGEMVLVHRYIASPASHTHGPERTCDVFRVDLDAGKMVPVRSLDGRAVFIGECRALSVFPSIIADAVYPSFEFREKTRAVDRTEAYRLADRNIESSSAYGHHDASSGFKVARPYTIADFLSLHIRGYKTS
ncbi:hypothetical protein PR202_ga29430 [Eleusine coracana subsp. coracana]|uniref:KIB1-4 beta-propeller domain-containing protein n=1 Tax=Eleusine coracana subsp. coracana TaxID=191504 RepID=A0AAV5DL49_ELECO|nr:hypothetical protein QOZ80_7AG0574200 [Eleusine coracana subsp. coracana]GJN11252.1 hypothetical protein PR202_ga29430 [Eleusine coracana subsp. coracana]